MKETATEGSRFLALIHLNVGLGSCTIVSLPPARPGERRRYGVVDCNDAHASPVDMYLRVPPAELHWETGNSDERCMLEFVALTHYDRDHFNGVHYLVGADGSRFRALRFLGPMSAPGDAADAKYAHESWARRQLDQIEELTWSVNGAPGADESEVPHMDFWYGGMTYRWWGNPGDEVIQFRALAPMPSGHIAEELARRSGRPDATNLQSGALRIQFGRTVAVLGGDVEDSQWDEIVPFLSREVPDPLVANLVLVPHHGGAGNTRSLWDRLSRLSARSQHARIAARRLGDERTGRTIAVVSCGSGRSGIPSRRTLELLGEMGVEVFCTNPHEACRQVHGEPPCVAEGPFQRTWSPLNIPGVRGTLPPKFIRTYESRDLLQGSVVVKMYEDRAPEVLHLGRRPHKRCMEKFGAAQ